MFRSTLRRTLGAPLAALALTLTVATSALAGGGEMPTGPSVSLSPPSFALDGRGGVVVTQTLSCWDEAVAEAAVVDIGLSLGQRRAAGGTNVHATCAAAPQTLTYTVDSFSDQGFRPGPVEGFIEFETATSKGAGHAAAPIDDMLLPAQAGR